MWVTNLIQLFLTDTWWREFSFSNPDIICRSPDWFNLISDPYKDPEVEEWAAIKIQRSFKDFKTQKSRQNLVKGDTLDDAATANS